MANVEHAFFSWVSTEGNDMAPGETHFWWMAPTFYGEAVSVTARAARDRQKSQGWDTAAALHAHEKKLGGGMRREEGDIQDMQA
jgi:hypothetical protein